MWLTLHEAPRSDAVQTGSPSLIAADALPGESPIEKTVVEQTAIREVSALSEPASPARERVLSERKRMQYTRVHDLMDGWLKRGDQPRENPVDNELAKRLGTLRSYSIQRGKREGVRYSLLETTFKYPFIRLKEETVKRDGEEVVVSSAVVADRYLIRVMEGVEEVDVAASLQQVGGSIEQTMPLPGVYLVHIPLQDPEEPEHWGLQPVWNVLEGLISYAEEDLILTTASSPDQEPYLVSGEQWGLQNQGVEGALAGADIEAVDAWQEQSSAAGVVVAVIDTGVNYAHVDLADRMWVNPGETPDDNIDNDGNGVIDDVHGLDAYANDGDPADDNGHGTHCAGIIGADSGNGYGMTGVAPDVTVMALKFLSENGAGATSDALLTIQYALDHGADILNLSWGSPRESALLEELLRTCGEQGMLIAAAAGNDADNVDNRPMFPGSFPLPALVTVAATDARDQLAGYSNYGPQHVEIAAPGTDILSTWIGSTGAYNRISGTSMATPHVAGVLALLRARYPSDESGETILRLLNGAESLSTLSNKIAERRRLNAHWAMTAPATPANDLHENAYVSDLHVAKWWGSNRYATDDVMSDTTRISGVWYQWSAPETGGGLIQFEADETMRLTVYRSSSPEPVPSSGPYAPGEHSFSCTAGVDYLFVVHGAEEGDFSLSLQIPPGNDDREDAYPTRGPYWTTRGSSLGATLEYGETDFNRGSTHSVWWAWTAPYDGAARIHTQGSDFDTVLAVYSENQLEGFIQGKTPDVVFVTDISGSTLEPFRGAAMGDSNQDGRDNTVLDAEITAINLIADQLTHSKFYTSSRSALVTFDSGADRVDLNPVMLGEQVFINTPDDADANGRPDLWDVTRELRAAGRTNFEAALQQALLAFDSVITPPGNGNVVFLSDGHPNEGLDYQDEVAELRARGINVRAFGTGLGASLADLRQIDPLALIFVDAIDLMQILQGLVAFNDDHNGLYTSEVNLSVSEGVTYFIRVDGYGGETGEVVLNCNMYSGLEILNQSPGHVRIERDTDGSLFVETRGVAPIRVQWFKDGDPLDGETGHELELTGVTALDAGVYHATVANRFERLETDPMDVEVYVDPPRIVRGPQSRRVEEGSPVTLSVEHNGTPPFSYQWYRDTTPLSGETFPTLYWSSFQASDSGTYSVRVSNDDGSATSLPADIMTTDSPVGDWRFPEGQGPIWNPDFLESVGGRFLAFKHEFVATTTDGIYWDFRDFRDLLSAPENGFLVRQVITRHNLLVVVAVNNNETVLFTTSDGKQWTEILLPQFISMELADGGDHWLASVTTSDVYYEHHYSIDLVSWTKVEALVRFTEHILKPIGSEWAYLAEDDPSSPNWSWANFNDASWPRGTAEFGYGEGDETTVLPNDPAQDRIYFRQRLENTSPYYRMKVKGRIRYDDAAIVRVNGDVVYDDYNGGPVTAKPEGFEDTWVEVPLWDNPSYPFPSYDIRDMKPGSEPFFSAEIFKAGLGDTDLTFDMEVIGEAHHGMYGPTFDGTQWLLIRGDGTAFISQDGLNWNTEPTTGLPFKNHFSAGRRMRTDMAPIHVNGIWVVWFYERSSDKGYFTSPDGITWTEQTWPTYIDRNNWTRDIPLDSATFDRIDGALVWPSIPSVWRTTDGISWEHWFTPEAQDPAALMQNLRGPSRFAFNGDTWLSSVGSRHLHRTRNLQDLQLVEYQTDDFTLEANRLEVHNGRLYAVERYPDFSGNIKVSTDGSHWHSLFGLPSSFRDVVFHDGVFLIADNELRVGSTPPHKGYIRLMTDYNEFGAYVWRTLEKRDWPLSWLVYTLTVSGDTVIAAGQDGGIATTTDLKNWTLRRVSSDAYGDLIHSQMLNGVYFAYSTQGKVLRSEDLVTFTPVDVDSGGNLIRDGAYGNGVYLLACEQNDETVIYRSTDGVIWNRQSLGSFGNANGLAFGDGGFVLVAGKHSFYSTDGLNWTQREQVGVEECKDVAWYNGSFRISAVNQADLYTTVYRSGNEVPPSHPTVTVQGFEDTYHVNDLLKVWIEAEGPASISQVDIYLNQKRVASGNQAPFLWESEDLQGGTHDVAVYVTDANGNTGLYFHQFTVEFPEAVILTPSRLGKMDTILHTSQGVLYGYLDGSRQGTLEIFRSFDGRRWRPIQVDPDRPVGTASLTSHVSLTEMADGSLLIIANQSDSNLGVYHSQDGVEWVRVHEAPSAFDQLIRIEEHIFLIPKIGNEAYYTQDGQEWVSVLLETGGERIFWVTHEFVQWKGSLLAYALADHPLYYPSPAADLLVTGNGLQWTPVQFTERFVRERTTFLKGPDHLIAWDPENGASQSKVSTDGVNWSPLSALTALPFVHLQVVDGLYIGTTTDGLWRSSDLQNWTQVVDRQGGMSFLEHGRIYPMATQWVWMDFRNQLVSDNIRILAVSDDQGASWKHLLDYEKVYAGEMAANATTLLVQTEGTLTVFQQGIETDRLPNPLNPAWTQQMAFLNGEWLIWAVNPDTGLVEVAVSSDLDTWSQASLPFMGELDYIEGVYVLTTSNRIAFSSDFVAWQEHTELDGIALSSVDQVGFSAATWLVLNGTRVHHSADRVNWSTLDNPQPSYSGKAFLVDGILYYEPYRYDPPLYQSTDFTQWVQQPKGFSIPQAPLLVRGDVRLNVQDLIGQYNSPDTVNISIDGGEHYFSTGIGAAASAQIELVEDVLYVENSTGLLRTLSLLDFVPEMLEIQTNGTLGPGSTVDVSFDIRNRGYMDQVAIRNVAVQLVLSPDENLSDNNNLELGKGSWEGRLDKDATVSLTFPDLALPVELAPGAYYLGVRIDAFDTVTELNENNNNRASSQPVLVIGGSRLRIQSSEGGTVQTGYSLPGGFTQSDTGLTTLSGDVWFSTNTQLRLIPKAQKGYRFVGWQEAPGQGLTPLGLTMDGDKTITPLFEKILSVHISIQGEGAVTSSPADLSDLTEGQAISLNAVPEPGWRFLEWGGDRSGDHLQQSFTLEDTERIQAVFVRETIEYIHWRNERFNVYERLDSAVSGEAGNSGEDDMSNLVEYMFKGNPKQSDSRNFGLLPSLTPGIMRIRYLTDPRISDYRVILKRSTDLQNWQPVPASWSRSSHQYNEEEVEVEVDVSGDGQGVYYYRFEIEPQ